MNQSMRAGRQLAWIGIGANLGDALGHVNDALARLALLPDTTLEAASSLYRTAPIESSGDDYINAVARIATTLAPLALLHHLQAIELAHGRERPYRNAPRTLDLDILLYGEAVIDTALLQVPHPRLAERAFVLVPLLEIDPQLSLPGRGPAADLLPSVAGQAIARVG